MKKQLLGTLISGSLQEGFIVRLNPHVNLEQIKTGKFVSIMGEQYTFFSLISDLTLAMSNPDILLFPPTAQEPVLQDIVRAKHMYATATLRPMLMLSRHDKKPIPVKTIPAHFAQVYEADKEDISHIFGDEKKSDAFFAIGQPLDMDIPVCLNLEKLVERSSGIFGKTGTGKTFLTRLVIAGLIKNNKAVSVIFDMHSEYGSQARKEGKDGSFVKGLKTLFPDKVAIFSLDPASTRQRGASPDVALTITYQSIHVEDVISLHEELNLHPTACESAYLLAAKYKQDWLIKLLASAENLKELSAEIGANAESIAALYRKLKPLERFPFITAETRNNVIDQMMEYIDRDISIIIEFGNYTSTLCYLLVANIITRRIHAAYIKKTEKFLGTHRSEDEPRKLIIAIEEAHKFLNPQTARQTIFGTIAREMRKYYVSLLVIDQRPSGIDPEILSQIGTKIVAQVSDEKDINAIFTGVSGGQSLRAVLASLDSKKQVLLLGHALTMPIVIETRSYDETFYKAMALNTAVKPINELIQELF